MAVDRQSPALPSTALAPPRTVGQGYWGAARSRLAANRLALLGLVTILLVSLMALFANVLAPYDPAFQNYQAVLVSPGADHSLGTDNLGRDTWSRLLYGARTSLSVGLFAQVLVLGIGLPIGAIAGLLGGRTDNLLMRGVDIVYAFPDLLLIILLRSIFGGNIFMIFLAIGLVEWTTIARLARGQVLALKGQEFVLAAHAIGARWHEILLRHLLPNGIGPIIVAAVFGIPRAIFAEAALSYIGIGVQPPTPSWGTMVQEGYQAIFAFPHLILAPALAIALLTLSFTFLGDGLRDALDPQMPLSKATSE